MIYFDLKQKQEVIDNHYVQLRKTVLNRINKTSLAPTIRNLIRWNIKQILIGDVERLEFLNRKLRRNREYKADKENQNIHLEYIFNYRAFRGKNPNKYDAYDLAKSLGVRTCLYCNRLYTLTVMKGQKDEDKFTRPDFDHFIDKGKNPLLALSIYNLVPCCKICNSSLKGTKPFTVKKYVHPYKDDFSDSYWYRYIPYDVDDVLRGDSSLKVGIDTAFGDTNKVQRIKRTTNLFKLDTIYSAHSDELKDLFEMRHLFSKDYLEEIKKNYRDIGLTDEDYYRIVFGVSYNESDFYKRPFSKIKKDLLKELNIIS
jgi:hypothetical protein